MENRIDNKEKQCNIIIENRSKLSVSSVSDVESFDEENIILITSKGTLVVKGNDFHINKLNVETGEVIIEGDVESCEFDEKYGGKNKAGFWSKMFK